MSGTSDIYLWTGQQTIRLAGSGLKEDTLRVATTTPKTEIQFVLRLPTLCITYADLRFQNAIGGQQANYPASSVYGPAYFDPPVELNGEEEIERFTYIRNATRVVIGPKETVVEFPSWKELVIPRLRLDLKDPAEAVLGASQAAVRIDQPLVVLVRQYADGRHVGGATLEVRPPNYQPGAEKQVYQLWVRVLDANWNKGLPEVQVETWHWDDTGPGKFNLDGQYMTDAWGEVAAGERPSGELEAVSARLPGWRVTPRAFRPLAGQPVRISLRAWKMKPAERRFTWEQGLDLEQMGERCGMHGQDILDLNKLAGPGDLQPGMRISLPCFEAALRIEPGDSPGQIAERFRFADPDTLAKANGLGGMAEYDGSLELQLPGWHFFHAAPGDTLETFDKVFNLPASSCVAVGWAFRPQPGVLVAGEVVGVPV
jgi:hypothetical protein